MSKWLAAVCVLAVIAFARPAAAQQDGNGRVGERKFPDNPAVLSPPIVMEPVYGCSQAVGVRG
jgi:hypothetical protein